MTDIEKIMADIDARLAAHTEPVVPDVITYPIDCEMIRLGRAQAVLVPSVWVGGEDEWQVIDNATTLEEKRHAQYKRNEIAAVLRERKKHGDDKSQQMSQAIACAQEFMAEGVRAGEANSQAASEFGFANGHSVRNAAHKQ